MYFAPTDAQIDRVLEVYASGDKGKLSKERVVSAHFAPKGSLTTFKTLAGVIVREGRDASSSPH